MSAHAADSQCSFQLPSLSYIDASWEEPELRAAAKNVLPSHESGFSAWLRVRIAAFKTWRRNNAAAAELGSMSDYQLLDMGVSRSDFGRLFDPAFNEELKRRGSAF